jgi:hypothetical protein
LDKIKQGKVDINYSKLPFLVKETPVSKADQHFLDVKLFSDLTANDLDTGLKGKEEKLHSATELKNGLKKIKRDQVTESTKALYHQTMIKRNHLKSQIENARLKDQVVNSREQQRSEKEKRIIFMTKVGRSLDAARAVNEAYIYKEKQNIFQARVEKNKEIKRNVQQTGEVVSEFKKQYRISALKKKKEEKVKIKNTISTQAKNDIEDKNRRVKIIKKDKTKISKENEWSKKNAQKFAEYYLKLGNE